MDIKSVNRYAEATSVLKQGIDAHEPITLAEQRPILEATPSERFEHLWRRADSMLGNKPHNRGVIISKGKTESGLNILVALTLKEVMPDPKVLIRHRVIVTEWKANGEYIGKPEVASDDPNFLANASDQDTEESRNLALVEESVDAAETLRFNSAIPQSEPVVYLV